MSYGFPINSQKYSANIWTRDNVHVSVKQRANNFCQTLEEDRYLEELIIAYAGYICTLREPSLVYQLLS